MELLNQLSHFYLLAIAWTLMLYSPLASSSLTGQGFVKLITGIAAGALAISFFDHSLWPLKLLLLCLLAIQYKAHPEHKSLTWWFVLLLIVLGLGYLLFEKNVSLFLLSSALLFGIINYAMILGHWYLVVPKLTEKPLIIANYFIWILLLYKTMASTWQVLSHSSYFEEQTALGDGYAFNNMLLVMRYSFGYLVIAVMSYFNFRLLKLRSLQSATGILYAMTFFTFVGELVSLYFYFKSGLSI